MKVFCFGVIKEIIGTSEYSYDLTESIDVKSFRESLVHKFPALVQINSFMIAIDQEYALDEQIIQPSQEIALIPPVSGG